MQLYFLDEKKEIIEINDNSNIDIVIKESNGDTLLLSLFNNNTQINIIGDDRCRTIFLNNILLKSTQKEIVISGFNKLIFEGDFGRKELIVCENINEEELFDDVKLPFTVPEYATYPKYTAIMSILAANNREKTWIYNNFILLWADLWVGEPEYWNDFKFSNELIQVEFCPLINKQKLKDDYFNEDNFLEKLKKEIKNGGYFCLSLDMYDIDEWWTLNMDREHYTHQTTFYGYSDKKQIFYVADFFAKKYKMISLPYELVQKAYFKSKKIKTNMVRRYVPDEKFTLIDVEYDIDLERIKNLIASFINSTDATYYDFVNIYKRDNVVYGFKYLERLLIHLKDSMYNNSFLDMRPFELIHEMNEIMVDRIDYLICEKSMEVLTKNKADFEEAEKLCSIIVNLIVKFKISRNKKVINRIMDKYQEFVEKQKMAFINLANSLNVIYVIEKEENKKTEFKSEEDYHYYKSIFDEHFTKLEEIIQKVKCRETMSLLKLNATETVFTDNYWRNVFPFEKERAGKRLNGSIIEKEQIGNGVHSYYFDDNNQVILNELYENEYTGYSTIVSYVYLYENDKIFKLAIYDDKENNTLEIGNCWVLLKKDNVPFRELYYGKNGVRNITEYIYDSNCVLRETRVTSLESSTNKQIKASYWDEQYYYTNNVIKQIVNFKNGLYENVYPKYGVAEYDNYYIKQQLVKAIKKLVDDNNYACQKITKIDFSWDLKKQAVFISLKGNDFGYTATIYPYGEYIADNVSDYILPEIAREIVYEMINNNELCVATEVSLCVKSNSMKKEEKIEILYC